MSDVEKTVCTDKIQFSNTTVYPGPNSATLLRVFYLEEAKVKEWTKMISAIPGAYVAIPMFMISCISYDDDFGVVHHTPYVLMFSQVRNGQPCCAIPVDADELANSDVVIRDFGFGGMPPD
jgi:hypothetical protein